MCIRAEGRSYMLALLSTDNNGFLEKYKGITVSHCLAKEMTPVARTADIGDSDGFASPIYDAKGDASS